MNHASIVESSVCSVIGGVASKDIPTVTGGLHSKIANGSELIEIDCTSTQGRFLKVCLDLDLNFFFFLIFLRSLFYGALSVFVL